MEEWRQVEVNKNYEVSSLGRLRNKKGKIIKQTINDSGYYNTQLWYQGKRTMYSNHILVSNAFLDLIPNTQVNHKDGNKLNNCINNLERISRLENMRHAFNTGLNPMRERLPLVGKDTQFKPQHYHTWIHKEGYEFYGTAEELVRKFPEQKLTRQGLHKIRSGYEGRTQHKGWTIKKDSLEN
jgi:hypothetical protein